MANIEFNQPETGPNPPAPETPDFSHEPNRPDWLPPHFKDVESYHKSFQETQAELTRTKQQLSKLTKGEQDPPTEEASEAEEPAAQDAPPGDNMDEAAQQLADKAGFDLDPYAQEYAQTGDVAPENRDAIAKGLEGVLGKNARQVVDDYIESRKALQQNDTALYMETAGGQEQYQEMVQWAAQNMTREQVEAYNKQVNSGDRHSTLFAIESLKAKYEAANGRTPSTWVSGARSTTGTAPFRSSAEMRRAMTDPRYKTDQAYRDEVAARLALSDFQ